MVKKSLVGLCLLAMSHTAAAVVANAGFEQWSGGAPAGWSTIDSGISVSAASTAHGGSQSAAVTVNTGDQGATDFRQSVSVQGGQSYTFSVWLRHTEGGVRARLYVDGYRNYSDPALTGQWQQISYAYTAGSSGSIEVGLRFYDLSGFDGSETVYVDDFQPAASGGGSGGGSCVDGELALSTDSYGYETSWDITDGSSVVQASGSGYGSNQSYTESVCLDEGDYTFTIHDSYGDGICCGYGSGAYSLSIDGSVVASGGSFGSQESTAFSVGGGSSGGGGGADLDGYYASADGLTGYALKSALHDIISSGHVAQGYGALWSFYSSYERDDFYEADGSLLDIYSENPAGSDPYVYTSTGEQCGSYNSEADCYNREHSFPRSWFGGAVEPMNSDVQHIFATDGYVNSKRGSYPYGEVGSASYTSQNGSRLGSAAAGLGYSGTVFEPIDEFKGDLARAYFYMATRYEDVLAGWASNSSYGDAVLDGSSTQVFEAWFLALLKSWHQQDPVSQKEVDRNDAAYGYQGNRNPYVDHPELVGEIWGN